MPAVEALRSKLWDQYQAVPDECRHIVNLLAVNWGSLNKTELRNALRKVVGSVRSTKLNPAEWLDTGLLEAETAWNGSERYGCDPLLSELVVRQLVSEGSFASYVELARAASPLGRGYYRNDTDIHFESDEQLIREVRIGMYLKDEAYIRSLFESIERQKFRYWDGLPGRWPGPERIYAMVCGNPFDLPWFKELPDGVQRSCLPVLIESDLRSWRLNGAAYQCLIERCDIDAPSRLQILHATMVAALYRGELDQAERLNASDGKNAAWLCLCAWRTLLKGDVDLAIEVFGNALKLLRQETGNRKCMLDGMPGVLFVLALSLRNRGSDVEEARKLVNSVNDRYAAWPLFYLLRMALDMESGDAEASVTFRAHFTRMFSADETTPWVLWLGLFILHRYDPESDARKFLKLASRLNQGALADGLAWPAAEMAALIGRLDPKQDQLLTQAATFEAEKGVRLLTSQVRQEAPWERALNAISNAVEQAAEIKTSTGDEMRLVWLVHETKGYGLGYQLEPREQKRTQAGAWSKGKVLSLKKILELANSPISYLAEHDFRIASNVVMDRDTRGYELTERGWLALEGHPLVFSAATGNSMEICRGEPEFRVSKQAKTGALSLEFWPRIRHDQSLVVVPDGFNRLKLIQIKPEHRKLSAIIGSGIDVPEAANDRVLATIGAVSSLVAIQSDISGGDVADAESVEADPAPRVQLSPDGEGLRIGILVRPFGSKGSYLVPGSGSSTLIAEIDGKRIQTQRDLKRERELADSVKEACPTLMERGSSLDSSQWSLEDAESSLEVLLELNALNDQIQIEWPQGEKFRVLGQAGMGQFSLRMQQQRDWFGVSGQLKLDGGEVIEMQRLLELLDESRGRFIRLDENRFLALTDAFRRRLEDLRSFSEKHGKDRRISALALPIMEELAEEVDEFVADSAWKKQVERLRQAEQHQPRLPSTLQAELRDYQREGFDWLSRLAAWGVGACLADDMGLGKTLQAIALMLSRATGGPTLVIAPTSVCFNWQNEVARFAPTLSVKTLNQGNREQLIEQLRPMDVVLCSYGLLQQDTVGELLVKVAWHTVVLDEAQAIKNPATKRAKQAVALNADFKLITTGTPVENHLGELWALFRFINPQLLGSLESFNRRFAGPIDRNQDREARQRLKRIIQPFILRRTKAQVLDELPPRTEIELQVELSDKEASFYEALRRKLLMELDDSRSPAEDKRFQVLAAITKLRRACCSASLVAPDISLPSSKLALFGEVLDELLSNRHKALVFSQFVDHLHIIRSYLDDKGVSYQYLDGQTPANMRKQRVEAFQDGNGDVFLISLKAGGTGLNLTAADYVIHMDPWWNPAVEDQASDRAHRIGQRRPVTVYRLITQDTIEQQIVSLHRQKRDLADSLLDGGELSARISADDLLALMRENQCC
jgi:superfamily II DNA or RNA helicase